MQLWQDVQVALNVIPPLTDRHLLNKMCCSKRKEDPDRRGVFICTNLIPCPHEQAPEKQTNFGWTWVVSMIFHPRGGII